MKVWVTGATGFVGRHVVNELLQRGHQVIAVARDAKRAGTMPWHKQAEFVACDLIVDHAALLSRRPLPDALVHLAWPGLPNYHNFFHIGTNLRADLAFLPAAVSAGISQIMVAGTCLEYGLQNGPLTEEMVTAPHTTYGFAKDSLRKSLQMLQRERPFTLQWMRLFYMFGDGQNPNSLLAHLDQAIDDGDDVFNMSMGDQLRDYSSIEDVASNFALALESPTKCHGVINCCSGKPTAVVDLVTRRCKTRGSNISLNRGYYTYPDYEPMAFWGVPAKLNSLR
ncbi:MULTISPECIES: NAD(P)-dependent oxidoreductase [unclassified Bradyrhizobium]|uniref:NAD-dependent epimerase/dehydratase family protein n=1 Tax=unclassified Bradyrhizobium TaxID=2631580 RepID=UPI001FFA0FC1|nr:MULTISPECIES: NAD(P)-dependent oxidoreductase [unclassified Bradyrhizobium]MCK1534624.1 NAD(P)-dependent oxidoreductase [Bradyrhizobium sp. 176]MCK1557861.1 NAD(P)-dependent oxidoreductase [Bradyrhizobium sp. 171]UPJ98288.1 NAD(P)-dependent oxidoreductase [Bradyrhizobium sp. 172]